MIVRDDITFGYENCIIHHKGKCYDTPGWTDTKNVINAWGCNDYETNMICQDRAFLPDKYEYEGAAKNFPGSNCCICGKSKETDDSEICHSDNDSFVDPDKKRIEFFAATGAAGQVSLQADGYLGIGPYTYQY